MPSTTTDHVLGVYHISFLQQHLVVSVLLSRTYY